MDMFQIAARYLGNADRAEDIAFNNPGNPLLYLRGTRVSVPVS